MKWDDFKDIKEGLEAVMQKSNGVLTLYQPIP